MYHNSIEDETPPRRRRGVLYILLVLIVIGGMLGSAIYAVFWFSSRATAGQVMLPIRSTPAPRPSEEVGAGSATEVAEATESAPRPELTAIGEVAVSVNRIAYIKPDGRVATIAADGQDERLLTRAPIAYQFPAWSPDGQYLAVIGGDLAGRGVYLLTDDEQRAATPRSLYFSRSETPFYLYWSPDSRQVSFLANFPGETLGLHLVSVHPGNDVRLLATGSPFYWDWTAASDQILIHSGFTGAASKLALLNATDASSEQEIARPGFFQAPGISANGRYLAYAEEIGTGLSELTIADRETGNLHRERHAGLVAMGWNPVGDQLAFISSAGREDLFYGPLRLIDAQSGETTLLSGDIVLAFFWSPDGRYLAVISTPTANNDLNVRLVEPTSGKPPAQLARSTRMLLPASQAVVQRRSPFLFDVSIIEVESGQSRDLYPFEPTRIFLSQFLPFFDQYALSHQLWSPRSDALVLPMRFDDRDSIFVVYANGDHPLRLADGSMPFWSWQ